MKNLLIVCHGKNTGRQVPTIFDALKFVKEFDSELFQAIRIHYTGSDSLPDVNGVNAIWFWLSDPLKEKFPDCYEESKRIELLASSDTRIVNPPDSLSNTIKSNQANILEHNGFTVAKHIAFDDMEELEAAVMSFPFPAILRADQSHSMRGLFILKSLKEFYALKKSKIIFPGTLVEYIDTRSSYQSVQSDSVWRHFYHKKRALVLGNRVDRRSALFSPCPIVKLRTCLYQGLTRYVFQFSLPDPATHSRGAEPGNWNIRYWRKKCIEADNHWWESGGDDEKTLVGVTRALGLDCAAIDYATTADGRMVIWEANPYFYMPTRKNYLLPNERLYQRRRQLANVAFTNFLRNLAAGENKEYVASK